MSIKPLQFQINYSQVLFAYEDRRVLDGFLAVVNVLTLLVPVIGGTLLFALVSTTLGVRALRWSEGRPLRRLALGATAAGGVVVAIVLLGLATR